jgi:glutathione synthase/RimK-type ligase-like ATP-grasp enzyme
MTLKVGLMVGREWSFPPAFIEEVNRRGEGVTAEFIKVGGTKMNEPSDYAVIVDRISHEVPYYRSHLKNAVLQGTTVINNPFMWTADDKFFEASLATRLGVAHPKTVAMPNKDYVPGIVHDESLRNLAFPLDWQGLLDYVGLPCVLKDAHGGGWKDVFICHTMEDLWHAYNQSGLHTMVLQEYIHWDHYVRCMCIGQEEVLPMRYDPHGRRYIVDHAHLSPELGERIVADALKLVRALGYDMNTAEFAIRDGVPYAIDFMNPAPDMDINSLTPTYFEWCVRHMADLVIDLAKNPRPQLTELKWNGMFNG